MKAYDELAHRTHAIDALGGAQAILHWDSETMMPHGAAALRGEQLAALAGVIHEKMTDAAWPDLIAEAEEDSAPLDDWQRANLREIKHQWVHANAVPADLVQAMTKASTRCEHIWREAKRANDYAGFAPHFSEVLKCVREVAAVKAEALSLSQYNALLDQYDPGLRTEMVDPIFAELQSFLPDMIDAVIEKQNARPLAPITDTIPIAKQEALGRQLMDALGFDFNHGRIDTSSHPFCGGVPGDIRLTTRYREEAFAESLYGVLHETGHALYEMGLPADWRHQPVGKARGMSVHESQSLLIEMQLSRSREFLQFLLPLLRAQFGVMWDEDVLYRQLTRVERSFIRVNADELTYPLHVIMRYRLEQALLSGDLQVKDLPGAWNDAMQQNLGITPKTDTEGCLQDIHWPGGAIGYFPTYTLGAMIAAQLFDKARQNLPDMTQNIASGQFQPLIGWLKAHVHSRASFLSTPELIEEATGQPLKVSIYKAHLKKRYLEE